MYLHGYALKWDEMTLIEEGIRPFYEQFMPGAFAHSISLGTQQAMVNHNSLFAVASCAAGTLFLAEDAIGLAFQIELDEHDSFHREIYELVASRKMHHASVMFQIKKEFKSTFSGHRFVRVTRADLLEISLTNNPAYQSSIVSIGRNQRIESLSKINSILKERV